MLSFLVLKNKEKDQHKSSNLLDKKLKRFPTLVGKPNTNIEEKRSVNIGHKGQEKRIMSLNKINETKKLITKKWLDSLKRN